jgi:hypothetical protein
MKTKTESRLSYLIAISLLTFIPSMVFGAGLAAVKEQSFHDDAGANIVVYSTLKESGPSVKIQTANQTFTMERQKLAGNIEVLSSLPANITTDTELEPVRMAVKEYRNFSTRFPKSTPILSAHITSLDNCIKEFEGGKAKYNGKWMPKEEALAAKQKEENSRIEEEAAIKREREEKLEFEKSQKAKGLAKYNGKWLPVDDVRRFVERDQVALNEAAVAANNDAKMASEKRVSEKALEVRDAKSARRIKGSIISANEEGLIVDCNDRSSVVASGSASVGGGGNVYIPPDPNGKGRPARAEGVFFITGHPMQDSLVDDDRIDVDAIEDGIYEYTSAFGAANRIKKYRVRKSYD